jgi:hypothetical protein
VVEEIAIASGIPVPRIFTLPFRQGLAQVLPGEKHAFEPASRTRALESVWRGLATLQPAELTNLSTPSSL